MDPVCLAPSRSRYIPSIPPLLALALSRTILDSLRCRLRPPITAITAIPTNRQWNHEQAANEAARQSRLAHALCTTEVHRGICHAIRRYGIAASCILLQPGPRSWSDKRTAWRRNRVHMERADNARPIFKQPSLVASSRLNGVKRSSILSPPDVDYESIALLAGRQSVVRPSRHRARLHLPKDSTDHARLGCEFCNIATGNTSSVHLSSRRVR